MKWVRWLRIVRGDDIIRKIIFYRVRFLNMNREYNTENLIVLEYL